MLVIAVLRSFLPAQRRGTFIMLLIAAVIASVATMHAVSGSPSTHILTHVSWATVVGGQATDQVGRSQTALDRTTELPEHPHEDGRQCHGTTATCLVVLASLLTLATLPAGALSRLMVPLGQRHFPVEAHDRPMRGPSLHAMGICRT
jgi:hypothetical protein